MQEGEGSKQCDAAGGHGGHGIHDGGHAGDQGDAGEIFKGCCNEADIRQGGDQFAHKQAAADGLVIEKFQADHQQQGQQKHRHGVAKEHAHGKTGQQAAHQASEGNGDEPDQQSEGEYLFIFLAQNMKGHRNGENQRAAQHGCHEKSGIQTGGLGLAQLHGQGIAAHVVGDEDPHQRRIQTEQMKDRTQCRARNPASTGARQSMPVMPSASSPSA